MKNELIRLLNRIEKKIYNDEQSRKTDEKQTSIARLGKKTTYNSFMLVLRRF